MTTVLERRDEDLERDLVKVDAGEDNAGIVTAELECDALEGSGAAACDEAAGCGRASEGDLQNA